MHPERDAWQLATGREPQGPRGINPNFPEWRAGIASGSHGSQGAAWYTGLTREPAEMLGAVDLTDPPQSRCGNPVIGYQFEYPKAAGHREWPCGPTRARPRTCCVGAQADAAAAERALGAAPAGPAADDRPAARPGAWRGGSTPATSSRTCCSRPTSGWRDYLRNPAMPFHLWLRQIARDHMIDAHRRHRVAGRRSLDREQPWPAGGGASPTARRSTWPPSSATRR